MKSTITLLLFWAAVAQAQSLNAGLIAYYPFTGGSMNDFSGNGHHGTNVGTIASADMLGASNQARYFNGSSNIFVPYAAALQPTTFPISVSMWAKFPSTMLGNAMHIFYNNYDTYNYYGLQTNVMPSGNFYAGFTSGGGPHPYNRRGKMGSVTNLCDDQWHMLTYVIYGATNIDLWVDCAPEPGVYSGTGGNLTYSGTAASTSIGANGGAQGIVYTTGSLDEIRFYNRALTQTDVNALYALGTLNVNLGPDQTTCSSVVLNPGANPGATYLWSTGATTQTITASTAGTYWVQVTKGCAVRRDTVALFIDSAPTVNLGADKTLCAGSSLSLQPTIAGNGMATYLWSNGQTGSSVLVSSPGTYWVQASTSCGSDRDTVVVLGLAAPQFSAGPDQTLCATTTTLVATGNAMQVLWVGPGIISSNGMAATVNQSGPYIVTGYSDNGCQSSDTVLITLVSSPMVNLGADTAVCDSFVLDAGYPGSSYLWSTGSTSRVVTYNASGTYWVQVTPQPGCFDRDTIHVTVVGTPVANFTATWMGGNTIQFLNSSVYATAYSWEYDGPGGSFITDTIKHPLVTFPSPGNRYVQLVCSNACGADTVLLLLNWEELTPANLFITQKIHIFPNPATESFRVIGLKSGIPLVLVNALGQTVWQGTSQESLDVPVSDLAKGVYWLQAPNNILPAKIVVN